tara:strand:- start:6951 stop:7448 length:498 start_codon:yes stop_codon:yes gene_type:complete
MASSNISMLSKTGNNIHSDECYTPKDALIPLLQYLDKKLTYYDCTSNISSNIVDFLISNGFNCVSSKGKDFLVDDIPSGVDVVLTNPPYSKKDKFIQRCYDINKPFALLLPVSSIQGQKRGKLFDMYGVELLVLNKRIDFTGKGSPHFGVAWFCKQILPNKIIFK